jgi:predicted Zn-dependent protease
MYADSLAIWGHSELTAAQLTGFQIQNQSDNGLGSLKKLEIIHTTFVGINFNFE